MGERKMGTTLAWSLRRLGITGRWRDIEAKQNLQIQYPTGGIVYPRTTIRILLD